MNAFTRKTLKLLKNESSVFKIVLHETFISFPIIYRFTNVLHKYMNSATAGMGSYRVRGMEWVLHVLQAIPHTR